MPLYTFVCVGCRRTVELRKSKSELQDSYGCKECGAEMKRQMPRTSTPVFKGKHWADKS